MGLLKDAINNLVEIFGLGVFETTIFLVCLTLFIWLYKEFKAQYHKDKELRDTRIESSLTTLSKILSLGHQYQNNNNNTNAGEFLKLVYESIPFIDYYLYKNIDRVIMDNSINETEKIGEIMKLVSSDVEELAKKNINKYLIKSSMDGLDLIFSKIKDIAYPIVASILSMLALTFLLVFYIADNNDLLRGIKIAAFITMFLFLPYLVDMFKAKKINKVGTILIPVIYVLLVILLSLHNFVFVLLVLILVLLAFSIFVFFGLD